MLRTYKTTDTPMLSRNITKSDIQSILNENQSDCANPVLERLFKGEYDFKGKKGRVIIADDQAFKINEDIGDIRYGSSIEMSSFYLQNVMSILIYRSLPDHLKGNTVRCFSFFKCNEGGISVYENCNQGDLEALIDRYLKERRYSELDGLIYQCVKDLTKVLQYLDQYGFIHNDLKMTNVLVDFDGSKMIFKLADMDNSFVQLKGKFDSLHKKSIFARFIPAPRYTAYENGRFTINHPIPGEELNGINYRQYLGPKRNIDVYTLVSSIIFHPPIVDVLSHLPLLSEIAEHLFTPNDITKILAKIQRQDLPIRIGSHVAFLITEDIEMKPLADIVIE